MRLLSVAGQGSKDEPLSGDEERRKGSVDLTKRNSIVNSDEAKL
jgi:hypothetical protein